MNIKLKFFIFAVMAVWGVSMYAQPAMIEEHQVVLFSLKSIHFIASPNQIKKRAFEPGIDATEVPFLKSHPAFLESLKKEYISQPLTLEKIEGLRTKILNFYHSKGRDLVKVIVPEQELTSRNLYVIIQEAHLGKVDIVGNLYFSDQSIRNNLSAEEGESLDFKDLKQDLSWINRNPFVQASAILSQGKEPNTTDLDIVVKDRWPYRFYVGADNTGTHSTGKTRLFTGVNFGNLFGLNQNLSYQFTSGTDYNRFRSMTVDYLIPFPWHNLLHVYGGYSQSQPHLAHRDLHLEAKNWQVDARYEIPINASGPLLQQIDVGFDIKRINNDLEFGGTLVQRQFVNVIQAVVDYNNGYQDSRWKSTIDLSLFLSPGEIGHDNTTSVFETLRPDANCHYLIFGLEWSASYLLTKGGWLLTGDLWGQVTTTNLIPTEQLILGGYNSIRGYEQSEVTVDDGLAVSFELHTPNFFYRNNKGGRGARDNLYFLTFVDYGWGRNHKLQEGEKDGINLLGVGAGVRYYLGNAINARFDYAFPLLDPPYSPKRKQRIFFGVVFSY
jgi:hemolysin activation/secretion protein